jgi:hypothetical protein
METFNSEVNNGNVWEDKTCKEICKFWEGINWSDIPYRAETVWGKVVCLFFLFFFFIHFNIYIIKEHETFKIYYILWSFCEVSNL